MDKNQITSPTSVHCGTELPLKGWDSCTLYIVGAKLKFTLCLCSTAILQCKLSSKNGVKFILQKHSMPTVSRWVKHTFEGLRIIVGYLVKHWVCLHT